MLAATHALLLSINFVTAPWHVENESGLPAPLDFSAQIHNVRLNGVRKRVGGAIPNVLHDHAAR